MCLMVRHYKDTEFDRADIADFHHHNPHGLGVMRVESGRVVVAKCLPRNPAQAWDFYRRHARGRECVLHFRQRTSGRVDLANVHPIRVIRGIWLMHNGVLGIRCPADGRSDTWHYAKTVLKPVLAKWPRLLGVPEFVSLVGRDIGEGNRMVFASRWDGLVEVGMPEIWYRGARMSNRYAWSSEHARDWVDGCFGKTFLPGALRQEKDEGTVCG